MNQPISLATEIQNAFQQFTANLKNILESTDNSFAQDFNALLPEIEQTGSQLLADLRELYPSSDDASSGQTVNETSGLLLSDSVSTVTTSLANGQRSEETIARPLTATIGMSLRRALEEPTHKWHAMTVQSAYDTTASYSDKLGSHKVNGVEIIPGANGYIAEAAEIYRTQAQSTLAKYWSS